MTTSSCCGSTLSTHCADEGTQCFVCMNCGKPCDAVDWKLQAETVDAERDKALSQVNVLREALEKITQFNAIGAESAKEVQASQWHQMKQLARNAIASIQ